MRIDALMPATLGCQRVRPAETSRTHNWIGSAPRAALLVAVTLITCWVMPAGAAGAALTIAGAPAQLAPRDHAVLNAHVSAGTYCRIEFRLHHSAVNSRAAKARHSHVQFVWTLTSTAMPGRWRTRVACASSARKLHRSARRSAIFRLVVVAGKGARHGHGAIARARGIRLRSVADGVARPLVGRGSAHWPAFGTILVHGSEWLGGRGTDVVSNGTWGCYAGCRYGDGYGSYKWQCVDLVERLVNDEGWYRGIIWGNGKDIYGAAPTSAFDHHPRGDGYSPVPGDIVSFTDNGPWGHVAVVEWNSGSLIGLLEENASTTGRTTVRLAGGVLSYPGFTEVGVLHARANTTHGTPPSSQAFHITADGVAVRTGPGGQYAVTGHLNAGAPVTIACQTRSSSVINGSSIWDRLADGTYVSDYYVSTPLFNQFSPNLAQCQPAAAPAAQHAFVSQAYLDLLGRALDPSGVSLWEGQLTRGASRSSVARSIATSPEYDDHMVNALYVSYLHRANANPVFAGWSQQIRQGATWEQVRSGILGSAEYFAVRGGNTNDGWLNAVYSDVLHRAVDPAGRAIWDGALAQGDSRQSVAIRILTTPEGYSVLVNAYYIAFLRRANDPAFTGWATSLQNGARDEDVIAGIVGSDEYLSDAQRMQSHLGGPK